ncbi:hypothetical protein J6590_094311 [Homalodisca vitripennis]|nr:hypothetical protein J6590_094311 [Homalodisca vitripennis]
MEDRGRNGPRKPPVSTEPKTKDRVKRTQKTAQNRQKKRPGQEMLKKHPGPPRDQITSQMADKPGGSKQKPPKSKIIEQGAFVHKNTKCLITQKLKDIKLSYLVERSSIEVTSTPHHKKTPKNCTPREN